MKNKPILSFILIWFFLIQACTGQQLKGKVEKISDGDTIWIRLKNGNQLKIRIWGIDTPEKFSSKKLKKEASRCRVPEKQIVKLGKMASAKTKELLSQKQVVIEPRGKGCYGRTLARIFVEGSVDFGLEMIRLGYACAYDKTAPEKYLQAEKQAKTRQLGLWKVNFSLMNCLCGF